MLPPRITNCVKGEWAELVDADEEEYEVGRFLQAKLSVEHLLARHLIPLNVQERATNYLPLPPQCSAAQVVC